MFPQPTPVPCGACRQVAGHIVKTVARTEGSAALNGLAVRLGGSMSNMGAGQDKAPGLSMVRSEQECQVIARLKAAMDPAAQLKEGRDLG